MKDQSEYISQLELFNPEIVENFFDFNKLEILEENKSFLNFKSLNSFDGSFGDQEQLRLDVQYSLLLAQRAANKAFPAENQLEDWYTKYFEVLQALGWLIQSKDYTVYKETSNLFELDKAIISLITDLLTVQQVKIFMRSLELIKSLGKDDKRLKAFERNSQMHGKGNFQMSFVQMVEGQPTLTGSGFIIEAEKTMTEVLFVKVDREKIKMSFKVYQAGLLIEEYAKYRELVIQKLGDVDQFIAALDI